MTLTRLVHLRWCWPVVWNMNTPFVLIVCLPDLYNLSHTEVPVLLLFSCCLQLLLFLPRIPSPSVCHRPLRAFSPLSQPQRRMSLITQPLVAPNPARLICIDTLPHQTTWSYQLEDQPTDTANRDQPIIKLEIPRTVAV
jgi:hypothetical protein